MRSSRSVPYLPSYLYVAYRRPFMTSPFRNCTVIFPLKTLLSFLRVAVLFTEATSRQPQFDACDYRLSKCSCPSSSIPARLPSPPLATGDSCPVFIASWAESCLDYLSFVILLLESRLLAIILPWYRRPTPKFFPNATSLISFISNWESRGGMRRPNNFSNFFSGTPPIFNICFLISKLLQP